MAGKILLAVIVTTVTVLGFSNANMQPFVCTHYEDGMSSFDVSSKDESVSQSPTTDQNDLQSSEGTLTSKLMTSAVNDGSIASSSTSTGQVKEESFSQSPTTDEKDFLSTEDPLTSKLMTSAVNDGSVVPSSTSMWQGKDVSVSQSPTTDQKDLETTEDALTSKLMTSAGNDGSITPSSTSMRQGNNVSVSQSPTTDEKDLLQSTHGAPWSTEDALTSKLMTSAANDGSIPPSSTSMWQDNGRKESVMQSESMTSLSTTETNIMSTTKYLSTRDATPDNEVSSTGKAVTCSSDDLPDVTNGSFSCSEQVDVGDVCNLTCIENYYSSSLSRTTCLDVGGRVGNWSNVTELVCSVNTCSFEDLPDVTSGTFDRSKCSGQNIDAVCNITCSPGLYPDYSDGTVCRSVDGTKAEWMVRNVHGCKDYWSETMMACIRDHNDLEITSIANIKECKDLCMQEQSFSCLSVDFGNNYCYLSSRNRHNIDLADDFVVPCYIPGAVYAERIDIAAWSSEVNTCLDGLESLWTGSLIGLDSCKLICSQTIGCCSLMFKDGLCHLSKSQRTILSASYPNVTTPSDGCNWVYTERIDKTCPIE